MVVEPRHFTEYHRQLLPIKNPILLAVQYATVATLGPGIAFGFLAYFASRAGVWPKRQFAGVILGFIVVLCGVEVLLLGIGSSVRKTFEAGGSLLFPDAWYPELSPGIVYTQSVNLSAYILAPLLGGLYLLLVWYLRCRRSCSSYSLPKR